MPMHWMTRVPSLVRAVNFRRGRVRISTSMIVNSTTLFRGRNATIPYETKRIRYQQSRVTRHKRPARPKRRKVSIEENLGAELSGRELRPSNCRQGARNEWSNPETPIIRKFKWCAMGHSTDAMELEECGIPRTPAATTALCEARSRSHSAGGRVRYGHVLYGAANS